jgi:ATP-dependent DNA helicase PIF1
LSRFSIQSDSVDLSHPMRRLQIPVKLAFAMAINKCQGQTFDSVSVYLRKPPFSHGQLYVALSRVRTKDKLLVQVIPDTLMGKCVPDCDDVFVPNIVYREAL